MTAVVILGMWRLVPETSSGGYGRPAAMRNSPRSRCSGWLRRWLLLGVWGQQKSTSQRISRGGHSGETPGIAGGAGVRAGSGKVAWRGRIQPRSTMRSITARISPTLRKKYSALRAVRTSSSFSAAPSSKAALRARTVAQRLNAFVRDASSRVSARTAWRSSELCITGMEGGRRPGG